MDMACGKRMKTLWLGLEHQAGRQAGEDAPGRRCTQTLDLKRPGLPGIVLSGAATSEAPKAFCFLPPSVP